MEARGELSETFTGMHLSSDGASTGSQRARLLIRVGEVCMSGLRCQDNHVQVCIRACLRCWTRHRVDGNPARWDNGTSGGMPRAGPRPGYADWPPWSLTSVL